MVAADVHHHCSGDGEGAAALRPLWQARRHGGCQYASNEVVRNRGGVLLAMRIVFVSSASRNLCPNSVSVLTIGGRTGQ